MEVVVCKKFRLIEQTKGKFAINKMRKPLRSSVKISKREMESYNKIASKTGIIYEVDEKATKERNEAIEIKPLAEKAVKLGIEIDGRWGKAKLEEEIKKAENPQENK